MWTNIVMMDEHTWNSHDSVSDPASEETARQSKVKAMYAIDARQTADFVARNSMAGSCKRDFRGARKPDRVQHAELEAQRLGFVRSRKGARDCRFRHRRHGFHLRWKAKARTSTAYSSWPATYRPWDTKCFCCGLQSRRCPQQKPARQLRSKAATIASRSIPPAARCEAFTTRSLAKSSSISKARTASANIFTFPAAISGRIRCCNIARCVSNRSCRSMRRATGI